MSVKRWPFDNFVQGVAIVAFLFVSSQVISVIEINFFTFIPSSLFTFLVAYLRHISGKTFELFVALIEILAGYYVLV